jgi:hypothetical protein
LRTDPEKIPGIFLRVVGKSVYAVPPGPVNAPQTRIFAEKAMAFATSTVKGTNSLKNP